MGMWVVTVSGAAVRSLAGVRGEPFGSRVGLLLLLVWWSVGLVVPAFGLRVGLPVTLLGYFVPTSTGVCVGMSMGSSKEVRVGLLVLSSTGF